MEQAVAEIELQAQTVGLRMCVCVCVCMWDRQARTTGKEEADRQDTHTRWREADTSQRVRVSPRVSLVGLASSNTHTNHPPPTKPPPGQQAAVFRQPGQEGALESVYVVCGERQGQLAQAMLVDGSSNAG